VQRVLYRDGVDRTVAPAVAAVLRARFADDVHRLGELLGCDVASRWGYAAPDTGSRAGVLSVHGDVHR
jgi:hypothetical protein